MNTIRAEEAIEIPEEATVDPGPGRVLVRIARSTEGRYGQIILPLQEGKAQFYGRVEAIPSFDVDDLDEGLSEGWLQVGDIVIFGKYSGTQLDINRQTFVICRETDILARIRAKE